MRAIRYSEHGGDRLAFKAIKAVFACAAVAGLATLVVALNDTAHPPSEGGSYLEENGYTQVKGGDEPEYLNPCMENNMSRVYMATDSNGVRAETTVCFGLFGAYSPFFGR